MTDGPTQRLVGEELDEIRLAADVHRGVFKHVALADELGVSEVVHGVGGHQTLLDGDYPLDAHALAQSPAITHDLFAEVTTHFVASELRNFFDGDIVEQHAVNFEVRRRVGHDLQAVPQRIAGDATGDLLVLDGAGGGNHQTGANQSGVDSANELAVLFGQHVLDCVVAQDLTDVHVPGTKFIDVLRELGGHDAVESHLVPVTTDVQVSRQGRERNRDSGRAIWFLVNDLDRLVGVNLTVEIIVGNWNRRHDTTVETIFTHLGPGEVVDGVNCLLLQIRIARRQLLEDRLAQELALLLSHHA